MKIIKLPGLIDVHVHLRDPGQTDKEDFYSGTAAAVAGGFTAVLDMPNNAEPIVAVDRQQHKRAIAAKKAVADIGFHYGSMGDNLDTFEEAAKYSKGLKLYLNNTTGGYMLDPAHLQKIYAAWPLDKPVLLHAEEDQIDVAIQSLKGIERHIHICHMPSREILEKIIQAKKEGHNVTCGVCAHHLFLTNADVERLDVYGKMLPSLKTQADQDFLWEHFDDIDVIESDHAPHTREEKLAGAHGVPGLETTLPLLMTAYAQGKITLEQIIEKCHTNPARLFDIPISDDTYVEFAMHETVLDETTMHTKCGWSPFNGQKVAGYVKKTVIRGQTVFEDGAIVAKPGSSNIL